MMSVISKFLKEGLVLNTYRKCVMNKILRVIVGMSCAMAFSMSHADFSTMNKYYTNSKTAPELKRCRGDKDCNAFYALSKQWHSLPNCFNTSYGPNCYAKKEAKAGNGYSLWKGASFRHTRSSNLAYAAEDVFYKGGSASLEDERIFAEGLAVLYFLDTKR